MLRNKFFLVIVSAWLAFVYSRLTLGNPKGCLYDFKKMVPLPGGRAELPLDLAPGSYLLKLKHKIQDGQEKKVFLNQKPLSAFRVRRKKVIETDYFYITVGQKNNILQMEFGKVFPKEDLDVRIANFYSIPNEDLSDDIFIFFRESAPEANFTLTSYLISFFLSLGIFLVTLWYMQDFQDKAMHYIVLSVFPFIGVSVIAAVADYIPQIPYVVLTSKFFFWFLLLFSYSLILYFLAPKAHAKG